MRPSCWCAPLTTGRVTSASPRWTRTCIFVFGCAETIRCKSSNVAIGAPSIASTRSIGFRPATEAAEPGITRLTTGKVSGRPTTENSPANSTIASRKFAAGPAATTIARERTDFSWNVRPASQLPRTSGGTSCGRSCPCSFTYPPSGIQASFHTVPTRSVQVIKACPKPIEKVPHLRRASAPRGNGRTRGRTPVRQARRQRR